MHYGAIENQHRRRHSGYFDRARACGHRPWRARRSRSRVRSGRAGSGRRAVRRVFRLPRRTLADQRTGAAPAQLRPPHVRRLRHQPVRAAAARRLRIAARRGDSTAPAAMANLLGDLWANGEPDWAAGAGIPDVKLHLYGKLEPRPGRKMGHLTALAPSVEQALEDVKAARAALTRAQPTCHAG